MQRMRGESDDASEAAAEQKESGGAQGKGTVVSSAATAGRAEQKKSQAQVRQRAVQHYTRNAHSAGCSIAIAKNGRKRPFLSLRLTSVFFFFIIYYFLSHRKQLFKE